METKAHSAAAAASMRQGGARIMKGERRVRLAALASYVALRLDSLAR